MRGGASDRLCNIQDNDHDRNLSFAFLLALHLQAVHEELWPPEDEGVEKIIANEETAVQEALRIYEEAIAEAAKKMQESDVVGVAELGRILESGDWSHLAV